MLRSMHILSLSGIALLPTLAFAAAYTTDAQKQSAARPLKVAIEACDKGAAVPLDPTAKAPPVQYSELLPSPSRGPSVLDALQNACQTAWAGAPKEKRLQLQWLRISTLTSGPRLHWLFVPQIRQLADRGNAEAQYLMFTFFRLHPTGADSATPVVSRGEAVAYLKKAAEQGHLEALLMLTLQYRDGPILARDRHQAVLMARRLESAPPQGISETAFEKQVRASAGRLAAVLTLDDDSFSTVEQKTAFAMVEKDSDAGTNEHSSALAYIKALRYGRGTRKDPGRARKLLELRLKRDVAAVPIYADMLARGEGGPARPKEALAMLRDWENKPSGIDGVLGIQAKLLLDGKTVGRQPQAAIRVLDGAQFIDDKIVLAGLLIDYHARLGLPTRFIEILSDAANAGETDAALAFARLKLSDNSEFRDAEGARNLLKPLVDAGNREALWLYAGAQYSNLDSSSNRPYPLPGGFSDAEIRSLIGEGMERKESQAFLLKAKLLRKGVVYPQDDQSATNDLINAANLGNVEAMVLLGDAYDRGLGTAKSARERLHAWREAARRGSLVAQQKLANAFTFDTFDKLMTLDEGVTASLVLYINSDDGTPGLMGSDTMASVRLGSMFSFGSRAMEAGTPAVADAVMKAFRVAPAGLQDTTLVTIGKALPDELRVAIEKKLKSEGFYSGQPNGYFGPDVRQALAAWVDAKGLVDETAAATDAGNKVQPKATDSELVSPDIVTRVRDRAFKDGFAAKTNKQKLEAISALNVLAQYGDMDPRWALVRNYHQARVVRKIVSPAEITRYALDILVTKPEGIDKADFEFIFDITQIDQDGQIRAFGNAVLDAIRDDPRLQDPLTLGGILQQFVFAPGACDALLDAGGQAKIANLGSDGCDNDTLSALIAFAKEKGPAGVDQAARKAAVTDVKALDAEAAK